MAGRVSKVRMTSPKYRHMPQKQKVESDSDRGGTTVTYVRPSSLMVIEENPPLLAAAQSLDNKLAAFVAEATDSASQTMKSHG